MAKKGQRILPEGFKQEALDRFKLSRGQFFANYRYKNLWWDLDDAHIGYGDLRNSDIRNIQKALKPDEEFVGWHEHHGSRHQITETPMVRITKTQVLHRQDIIEKEGV